MKVLITCFLVGFPFFLFAQEKGLTPIFSSDDNLTSNTYAVVVGISDYQDHDIPDLRFADKDALAFAGFLQSSAGGNLDEDHLKVLINEKATAAQFAIALDWLWEVVKENDRVILYFSGHGDVERKSLTQPGYLLCWDAPARVYLAGGAIALPMFQDVISTLSVQNKAKVIVITDACRSGKLSGSAVGGAQLTSNNLAKQYANEIKILSCQPEEYSIEGVQWGGGRGAFSYHLLDGLSGMADHDENQSVDLKEIGRYLEDKVTEEVAPLNQNPMVIGNKTEKLSKVFPEILTELKAGKKALIQLFTATESRGIEDDILAVADTNVVEMYLAFKESLTEKHFLEPADACADFYYQKLSNESQLEGLHSSMRRNYAAALQDDAQQVMNTMLKSGLTEAVLKNRKSEDLYSKYPSYLERAANLLGSNHYMYTPLIARKHFFEGMIKKESVDKRRAFLKAINLQADMAHAMVELIRNFEAEQLDSAIHYFQKATVLIPSWVEPYIAMSNYYKLTFKDSEKAEEMLSLAEQIDSTSILLWYNKANFYKDVNKLDLAEKYYLKVIEGSGDDICFPCANLNVGVVYYRVGRIDKAESYFKKALELDSLDSEENRNFCVPCAFYNLGNVYYSSQRQKAIEYYLLSLDINPNQIGAFTNLGSIYLSLKQYEDAKKYYYLAIEIDSSSSRSWTNLSFIYEETEEWDKVFECCQKSLLGTPSSYHHDNYLSLAKYYRKEVQIEKVEENLKKALTLNPDKKKALNNQGAFYIESKHFEKAKITLDQLIEQYPDYHIGYLNRAILAIKMNQSSEAYDFLEKVLDKGYQNIELLNNESSLEEIRKDPKWTPLIKKYFPDQDKH